MKFEDPESSICTESMDGVRPAFGNGEARSLGDSGDRMTRVPRIKLQSYPQKWSEVHSERLKACCVKEI